MLHDNIKTNELTRNLDMDRLLHWQWKGEKSEGVESDACVTAVQTPHL